VSARGYRLGRRQRAVDQTRSGILSAARELIAEHGRDFSVGKVAARAGVSRITVYNHFGSRAGLIHVLAAEARPGPALPPAERGSDPRDELRRRITQACGVWAVDPGLYRQLHAHAGWAIQESGADRPLVETLAGADHLRLGCSIKEAEDVIGILTSFPTFDRLHQGGRRSPAAVAEILVRLASELLRQTTA
jgi:AcrR family transcriptional regulator